MTGDSTDDDHDDDDDNLDDLPFKIRSEDDLFGPDGPNVHIWTSCDEGNADNPEVSHLETDDNLPGREHGLG